MTTFILVLTLFFVISYYLDPQRKVKEALADFSKEVEKGLKELRKQTIAQSQSSQD